MGHFRMPIMPAEVPARKYEAVQSLLPYTPCSNPFMPSDEPMFFMVNNIPDTVNPVKATLAYHH
jgi:hypothetical protein